MRSALRRGKPRLAPLRGSFAERGKQGIQLQAHLRMYFKEHLGALGLPVVLCPEHPQRLVSPNRVAPHATACPVHLVFLSAFRGLRCGALAGLVSLRHGNTSIDNLRDGPERVNDFASPGFMNLLCRTVVCLG